MTSKTAEIDASLVGRMIEDIGRETTVRVLGRIKITDNAKSLLDKIGQGLKAEEAVTIRRSTHALVGLLRQVGLEALGADLKAIENAPEFLDDTARDALDQKLDEGIRSLKELVAGSAPGEATRAA